MSVEKCYFVLLNGVMYSSLSSEHNIVPPHLLSLSLSLTVDLQNVDITLRILFRPEEKTLPWMFTHIGVDFDEKILPSITNEVLKGVVVSGLFE